MKKNRILTTLAALVLAAPLAMAQLPAQPGQVRPLLIGQEVPAASMQSLAGGSTQLADVLKKGPTALVFYRGGWCPYCNTHLAELQQALPQLKQLGYQLVAVSPDSPAKLAETVDKNSLTYTLYANPTGQVFEAFGVAYQAPKSYVGVVAKASEGANPGMLPVPSVFLVDAKGKVLFSYVNPDYKQRMSGKLLVAAAEALKQ